MSTEREVQLLSKIADKRREIDSFITYRDNPRLTDETISSLEKRLAENEKLRETLESKLLREMIFRENVSSYVDDAYDEMKQLQADLITERNRPIIERQERATAIAAKQLTQYEKMQEQQKLLLASIPQSVLRNMLGDATLPQMLKDTIAAMLG